MPAGVGWLVGWLGVSVEERAKCGVLIEDACQARWGLRRGEWRGRSRTGRSGHRWCCLRIGRGTEEVEWKMIGEMPVVSDV